jgi:hypothetical protein
MSKKKPGRKRKSPASDVDNVARMSKGQPTEAEQGLVTLMSAGQGVGFGASQPRAPVARMI